MKDEGSVRLSCALGGKPKQLPPPGGWRWGDFCWNTLSMLVLSVHTKFHLSGLPGRALKVFGGWWFEGDFSVPLWSKPGPWPWT